MVDTVRDKERRRTRRRALIGVEKRRFPRQSDTQRAAILGCLRPAETELEDQDDQHTRQHQPTRLHRVSFAVGIAPCPMPLPHPHYRGGTHPNVRPYLQPVTSPFPRLVSQGLLRRYPNPFCDVCPAPAKVALGLAILCVNSAMIQPTSVRPSRSPACKVRGPTGATQRSCGPRLCRSRGCRHLGGRLFRRGKAAMLTARDSEAERYTV